MKSDNEISTLEVVPPSALSVIQKAEIDVQIATAHQFPRSMQVFKDRAVTMATIDEETAASCLYRRPVGKEKNESGQWVEKFAEGMSIRMAEIVAASYGNLRVGAMIVEQTERRVVARGFAHDLETNYASTAEVVEVTVKRPDAKKGEKEGQPYDERMRAVIAKAALAKARRDAIFQVVPRALARPVEAAARGVVVGDARTLDQRREVWMAWVVKIGVEPARVFAALGVKGAADIGVEHLETLVGLRTALKEREITLDEAFPPIAPEVKKPLFKGGEKSQQPDGGDEIPMGDPKQTDAQPAADATDTKSGPNVARVRKLITETQGITEAGTLAYIGAQLEQSFTTLDEIGEQIAYNVVENWKAVSKDIVKKGGAQ